MTDIVEKEDSYELFIVDCYWNVGLFCGILIQKFLLSQKHLLSNGEIQNLSIEKATLAERVRSLTAINTENFQINEELRRENGRLTQLTSELTGKCQAVSEKYEAAVANHEELAKKNKIDIDGLRNENTTLEEELTTLRVQNGSLMSENNNILAKVEEQKNFFQESQQRTKIEFENLANRIFRMSL